MWDILMAFANNVPMAGLTAIGAGLLRSVAGWIENSWKDGKIDSFEWKQLGGTMVKYFSLVMLLMVGLPIGESVAAAAGLDIVSNAIKSKK